ITIWLTKLSICFCIFLCFSSSISFLLKIYSVIMDSAYPTITTLPKIKKMVKIFEVSLWHHFAKAYCGHGNNRHIQRINPRVVRNHSVTGNTNNHNNSQKQYGGVNFGSKESNKWAHMDLQIKH